MQGGVQEAYLASVNNYIAMEQKKNAIQTLKITKSNIQMKQKSLTVCSLRLRNKDDGMSGKC
jgi:hypothetical protein